MYCTERYKPVNEITIFVPCETHNFWKLKKPTNIFYILHRRQRDQPVARVSGGRQHRPAYDKRYLQSYLHCPRASVPQGKYNEITCYK